MASITFLRSIYTDATTIVNAGNTATPSMADALKYIQSGAARWTAAAVVASLPDTPGRVAVVDGVTSLTGGAPTGLDGYLLGPVAVGRMFDVLISGVSRRYVVIAVSGDVANGDGVISPPDYDATACNKFLLRIQ